FAAGVTAEWVVGDTVYGNDDLRSWLEQQHQPSVLAVPETHPVWMHGDAQPGGLVAALRPPAAGVTRSAGQGPQGARLDDSAWREVDAAPETRGGWGSWILSRRTLSQPSKRAYDRVWGPTDVQLTQVVRVAGRRWTMEAGLEEAKGEVGLDYYAVRLWTG